MLVQVSCLLFWKSFIEILYKCEEPSMEIIVAVGIHSLSAQLCACATFSYFSVDFKNCLHLICDPVIVLHTITQL